MISLVCSPEQKPLEYVSTKKQTYSSKKQTPWLDQESCSVCQETSEVFLKENECKFCGFKLCAMCQAYIIGPTRSTTQFLKKCQNPSCISSTQNYSWCSTSRSPSFSQDDFIVNTLLPTEELRLYFKNHDTLSLDSFTKITKNSFNCNVCSEKAIDFSNFIDHFDLECVNILMTCTGCKTFQCPRGEMFDHMQVCEFIELQCPTCCFHMLRKNLKLHNCHDLLSQKIKEINGKYDN